MSESDSTARSPLQLSEDMPFLRKIWLAQRIGWAVMALVVVAALLGVFGGGPLSTAVAGERGGALWVEHDRFARLGASYDLRVHWGPGQADADGSVRVWVGLAFLQRHSIEHVSPQPQSVEAGEDRLIYVFKSADPAKGGSATFSFTTARAGRGDAAVGLPNGATVHFWQIVYP